MSAFQQRVEQDLRKLQELQVASKNRVQILSHSGNPVSRIDIALRYPTAPSTDYPAKVQAETLGSISLLSRYPFTEPTATITTPIYHPNVYGSGKVCFGQKWLPTEGLDLLVKRMVKIITFDPNILNEQSPANSQALNWYRKAKRDHPESFPTATVNFDGATRKPKVSWTNIESGQPEKRIISCPQCKAMLKVPGGRSGNVICPKCSHSIAVA